MWLLGVRERSAERGTKGACGAVKGCVIVCRRPSVGALFAHRGLADGPWWSQPYVHLCRCRRWRRVGSAHQRDPTRPCSPARPSYDRASVGAPIGRPLRRRASIRRLMRNGGDCVWPAVLAS
uniref:Uncharacterized protein n=1 Tax=Plectus sambesii TaxID=2011161 RepID=A0A914X671_9BILA